MKKGKIRTLILGIGNTILTDDAAGIIVARKLYDKFLNSGARDSVELVESSYAPWRILDLLEGFNKLIIIDSIVNAPGEIGECFKIERSAGASFDAPHGIGLLESLELADRTGMKMPEEIDIYAVKVKNPFDFGESLTAGVAKNIPVVVEQIYEEATKINLIKGRLELCP